MLVNVIVGYSSIRKKSPLLRCSSRFPVSVWTLAVTISTATEESSGRSATSICPENSVKRPRTLVSMCRATNSTDVCATSSAYVPAAGSSRPSTSLTACDIVPSSWLLVITPVTTSTQPLTQE